MSSPARPANRLAREKSPYLLQHAHNPVDWFPWSTEAFAKARAEQKPIFLSIGYSTCHWCHVMERESFESDAVAAVLNRHFVSIKVDREERPDVDKIYMTYVQATTGAGGWPMSVFLTPELKPFYGGTYFPPEPRYGRPSFVQLLERIAELWRERRDELVANAEHIHAQLAEAMSPRSGVSVERRQSEPGAQSSTDIPLRQHGEAWLRAAGAAFQEMYDPRHGGFGRAPKFPQPSQPQFLLRYARRFGDAEAVRMVLHTCERMAAGGIHDQLGGGFARYSVDAEWLVPHFEKMLYDNAQLAQLYLDAHLLAKSETRNPKPETDFAAVARATLDYVLRDMTHPDGGFYSAEDADSEGHEGKFYCWTRAELSRLLTIEEFNVVVRHYGITEAGNFVDHSHPAPLPGQNVLSVVAPVEPADAPVLAAAQAKMLAARAQRVRPHCDDKILASWNGLMLGAFARASAVLGEEKYRVAAERNLRFLREKLWDASSRTLYHRWRDGERDSVQLLDAYAFLLGGVLDLYEATLAPDHLVFALELADALIARFHDPAHGGFWQSDPAASDLILRVKDDTDGAEPSGNSVATVSLLRLAALSGREKYRRVAETALLAAADKFARLPQAVPVLLQALDFWLDEPARIVIAGDPDAPATRELLTAAHATFQPNKVVLGTAGPVDPLAGGLAGREPAAFVCIGQACRAPVRTAAELSALLAD
ncbi:MAG: thioredoxin domain-containing protein [Limisphaerales bacterium]